MTRFRQILAEGDDTKPIGKRNKRKKGPKDPKRSAAARKNWASNRAAIVKGIRKYWASPEGKAMAKKLAAYRAKKESFEYDIEPIVEFFEEKYPRLFESFEQMVEEDIENLGELMEAAELLELGEEQDLMEAVVKARKKRRVDPARSRLMKLVRKKNKAAFAKGAKKAARTKKSNGTFKALAKFNAKEGTAVERAVAFLEGTQLDEGITEDTLDKLEDKVMDVMFIIKKNATAEMQRDVKQLESLMGKILDSLEDTIDED